jgi:excisionase family DNA binding protein
MEDLTVSPTAPVAPAALSTVDAAKYLGVGLTTLHRLTVTGELPSLLIGRARRYRRVVLDRWLEGLETK